MKYYLSYFKYCKDDYLYFLEQLQMDWATADHYDDLMMVCLGCILAVAIPTFLSPFFAVILYIEWRKSRKLLIDVFIKEL